MLGNVLLKWFLYGYSSHLWPLCIFKITDKCSLQFPVLFCQKSCCWYWFSTLCGEFCVSYMYVLLASLGKCALNQHISTKTRALFKLNQTRCQNFAGLHSFFAWRQWQTISIHGSNSNKWFISFYQLSNDTKWYAVLHCKHESETKMAQDLLFNMFNEWVSLHCFIHMA